MSFVSFGTHIFGDKTLQTPVHLLKLIINEKYLSSLRFISVIVALMDWFLYDSSFQNRYFVRLATNCKELNNTINPKTILYHF